MNAPPRPHRRLAAVVRSMHGLGDNIYQRPFVREATRYHEIWLTTPWPELYADLRVHFAQPATRLRTQARNAARHAVWEPLPAAYHEVRVSYGHRELRSGSILASMGRTLPTPDPLVLDLPPLPESPVRGRYAVVRPVTSRREWLNTARSPRPEYIGEAARMLQQRGLRVVSVADLAPPEEWLEGEPVSADVRFEHGELPVESLLALVRDAAVVVGGVGWIVPACLASRTPCVVIAGGQGGHNAPEVVQDPRIETAHMHWLLPDPYCRCTDMRHACPKEIPDFGAKFAAALEGPCA